MPILYYFKVSFRSIALHFLWVVVLLFLTSKANSQGIQILKSNGKAAVITEGTDAGVQKGELLAVNRFMNDGWKVITYAEVTHVRHNMARIQIVENAPQVKMQMGDSIEKLPLNSGNPTRLNSVRNKNSSSYSGFNPYGNSMKSIYLGPTTGAFIPLGDMKDVFEDHLGYGGIIGIRFRSDLDVSMRFFYAAQNKEWTFWSVQMLGRRYFSNNLLLDFGYGICYPEVVGSTMGFSGGVETIRLGFIGGFGYVFPIAFTTQFEIGCLFHLYPNMGENSGQFITIQGHLIL